MESPLNPAVWRFMFHAAVGSVATGVVFSLLHERYNYLHSMDEYFATLRQAKSDEDIFSALQAIHAKLETDAQQKKGSAFESASRFAGDLVSLARLNKDGENAESVSAAIQVILKIFGKDNVGRQQLYKCGAYRVLLSTLSEAQRQGNAGLLQQVAEALYKLSTVDDSEVVLDHDVPKGAEGAYALAMIPATVKMLRILDPSGPAAFLSLLTGIFANVCTLSAGAAAIAGGADGHSGMSYFLRLLENGNQGVIEHSIMAVRFLARAGYGHDELSTEESISSLGSHVSIHGNPAITNAVLTIIVIMLRDVKKNAKFFDILANKTDVIPSFFEVWCHGAEKSVRDRAEVLVQLLEGVPECQAVVHENIDTHRQLIIERRQKDEELRQKKIQQMRQQQMMQQMMMGGGGGPGMEYMM